MRFSLRSLAICLASTQAHFALASPCKPVTTTPLAASTTTTVIAGDSTTTVTGVSTITNALSDLSTTLTLNEGSTTTALGEESTTTTLAEDSTTTAVTKESTTTVEATTTTAAETTTTTEALEGTQMAAVFSDNTKMDTYFASWGCVYSTPQLGESTSKARFTLEPDTNRVFTYLPDGTKVYLYTGIPTSQYFNMQFDTPANINRIPGIFHFIQCTADADNFLSCASESGPTPIVWYLMEGSHQYSGTDDANYNSDPVVRFRLV